MTEAAQKNVVDLFSREQYRGGNGIVNLDSKLGDIGLAEIQQIRADSYNVSNFMFYLIFGTMAMLTIISGAQSVIIGYMMGGDGGVLSAIEATRMALFQLALLACGIVIGCWIGDTGNKKVLGFMTVILGGFLMVVTVFTGLAFLYFVQDVASTGSEAAPITHFFASVAANSAMFDTPQDVQKAFNIFCVLVFEAAVITTPILFKVINAPVREAWETSKRSKAHAATWRSKQKMIEIIASNEKQKLEADARIYRQKRRAEMETRAKVMADMVQYERRMADLWMKRKGVLARMQYKLSGVHDADDEFIKYATNADESAKKAPEEALTKKA